MAVILSELNCGYKVFNIALFVHCKLVLYRMLRSKNALDKARIKHINAFKYHKLEGN